MIYFFNIFFSFENVNNGTKQLKKLQMKNLKKMSLNLATKELSRKELKSIMAGSTSGGVYCPAYRCHFDMGGATWSGHCATGNGVYSGGCYCITGLSTAIRCY